MARWLTHDKKKEKKNGRTYSNYNITLQRMSLINNGVNFPPFKSQISISRNWKPHSWKSQFHSFFFFQCSGYRCSAHITTIRNIIEFIAVWMRHGYFAFVFHDFIRRQMCRQCVCVPNLLRLHNLLTVTDHHFCYQKTLVACNDVVAG